MFKLFFTLLISGTLFFSGCKKYEEGPSFTLRSPKGRITNEWTLVKVLNNGVEQSLSGATITANIKKDDTYIYTYSFSGITVGSTGKWKFSDDNEQVYLTDDIDPTEIDTITIIKLTSKELWAKEVDGSNTYEEHYEAK